MLYAIIAAGEGSRLSNEGYVGLKPMVRINGEMLIDRLMRIFINNDAEVIYIIINENSSELGEYLKNYKSAVPLKIITKSTDSSLHSFHELLEEFKDIEELCLTTTDSVFEKEEFQRYIEDFKANKNDDGLLAVTSFIDDESPLYINFDSNNVIKQITDHATQEKSFVSGGIYCLRKKALELVPVAINSGLHRMRNFQRLLIQNNLVVRAHSFNKIMDVDHVSDIEKAEHFLSGAER
ncbi:NDP-sugar pyrophosphorylase family protein [Pedobacter cryoconitis]|uniref:NDP-sugar pyrophosphorylase family protein n=1 Tax=Pedobacter cryoconitis TaxID=188932 RepID=A0A7W8YSC6_9SPHI|nr:sugar phosphate nucleotidyltransferase [Pedobacter cryoconitis]MBB5620595.1 NDP-sugar pyrophosphorylase family protein [Pedobacter cryoconitis]MBB5646335.1 NDP-sugar pyrophosphorylase family protein [Pedobacter cryoconitis]